jgi:signal transduction histidine kinase
VLPAFVRALLAEPRAPNAPARVWRDWLLVGVLGPTALLEGILRDDVIWRPLAIALSLVAVASLLWRRTHPLAMVLVVFGSLIVLNVAAMLESAGSVGLYTTACLLLLPYALMRWGSGREIALGLPVIVVAYAVGIAADWTSVGEAVGGAVFAMSPVVLGLAVRFQTAYLLRERDQVVLLEREQLARELHDTVAHHVSAIAVRAQAGRVVAATDPGAAVDALLVIEAEASRALTEMRLMVGALRTGEEAELAPQPGIADLERLARGAGNAPPVTLELAGDLEAVQPAVGTAVYRLAQESITNAVRHARHATRIVVVVTGEDDCLRLTVADDGEPGVNGRAVPGYGIVGMTERVTLLGGSLEAGPGPDRGWTVRAVLPRTGAAR